MPARYMPFSSSVRLSVCHTWIAQDVRFFARPTNLDLSPFITRRILVTTPLLVCLYNRFNSTVYALSRLDTMTVRPFSRTVVCYDFVNTTFWEEMNRLCCRMVHVVHAARGLNDQFWVPGNQRSRSRDVEVRLGDLAEALFSTPSVK